MLLSVSERHRRIVALQRDCGGAAGLWRAAAFSDPPERSMTSATPGTHAAPRRSSQLVINPPGSSHRGGSRDVGADNREPLTLTCDAGVNVM